MITKITEANDQEYYAPRFAYITEQIAARSDLPNITIDSIESYFANIETIAQLYSRADADDVGINPGYLFLVSPADEEYFVIDANARTISVPAAFKKNGVGVYGDHVAEMLVFKVDRYFDHQDLYNTQIAINWNFTATGSRTPSYEETQSQAAFAPNDVLEPEYVTFGFYITNEMTKFNKGVLNFSVTFYNVENGEVVYSLNTQTTSVNINDGLTLKSPSMVKDLSKALLSRVRNSAYTPEGVEPIPTPAWRSGMADPDNAEILLGLPEFADFNMSNVTGEEDEILVLQAQAYTTGLGVMKYTWSYEPISGNAEVVREADSVTSPSDYIKVGIKGIDITAFEENHIYYIKNDSDVIQTGADKIINSAERFNAIPDEDHVELYELGSSYNAIAAGKFQVEAQGTKTVEQGENTFTVNSPIATSNFCTVRPAAESTVALEVRSSYTRPENCVIVDDHVYSAEEIAADPTLDPDLTYTYISSQDPPAVTAVVTSSEEGVELGAVALEMLLEDDIDTLSQADIEAERYNETDNPSGKYHFEPVLATSGEFEVSSNEAIEEGTYRVRAINYRNHTYSVSEPSQKVVTSFVAEPITDLDVSIIYDDVRQTVISHGEAVATDNTRPFAIVITDAQHADLRFSLTDNTDRTEGNLNSRSMTQYFVEEVISNSDYTEFSPRKQAVESEELEPDQQADEFPVIIDDPNNKYFIINGDEGFYRIKTINNYNGTAHTAYSGVFRVTRG